MSFTDRLTLHDAAAATQDYDLVAQDMQKNSSSSVRRDGTRDLDKPMGITIAHTLNKTGTKVDTVVYIERTEVGSDTVTLGNGRVQMKISYAVGVITADHIKEMIKELVEFIVSNNTFTFTTTNVDKLLNREG